MRIVLGTALAFGAASLGLAAGIPAHTITGNYVEARTADVYTGPCFANGEAGLVGDLAVFGWKVTKGEWHGVSLDGLGVAAAVRASHTLGDVYESAYPVKAVLIVDSRADTAQRKALQEFAKSMSGDLLQDVVRVVYQPVDLTFADNNVHSMRARLTAGTLAKVETRAINNGDHICHNEEVWYRPLTKLDHAMPAVSVAHDFQGDGLGTKWDMPNKRSSFVGTFTEAAE